MKKIALLLFLTPVILSGCTPAAVTTGVVVGASATKEGGLPRAFNDSRIQIAINDLWFKYDFDTFAKLDLTVNQGRVLITGIVQDPDKRVEAVRLAWQPEGVKQVINEIRIAENSSIKEHATDAWISTRLRTKIALDKQVQSLNYSIDTVQGSVYLMGVAQNQEELDRVTETARTLSGVKQVVSYVKLAGTSVESTSGVE